MRKLCLQLVSGIDALDFLPLAKQAGFDGYFTHPYIADDIEEMRKVKQLGDSLGLECETSHSVMDGCITIWEEGPEGDEYIELMKRNLDNCVELGIPTLIVHIKPMVNLSPDFDRGIARLTRLVDYAAEKKIKIAFENINNVDYLVKTLEYFKQPHVGYCIDVGHESCNTPGAHFMPLVGDRLFCTHIHDNDCEHDQHMIPFDGNIDFDRVCRQFKECGYKGNITIEVKYTDEYRAKMTEKEFVQHAYNAAVKLKEMLEN